MHGHLKSNTNIKHYFVVTDKKSMLLVSVGLTQGKILWILSRKSSLVIANKETSTSEVPFSISQTNPRVPRECWTPGRCPRSGCSTFCQVLKLMKAREKSTACLLQVLKLKATVSAALRGTKSQRETVQSPVWWQAAENYLRTTSEAVFYVSNRFLLFTMHWIFIVILDIILHNICYFINLTGEISLTRSWYHKYKIKVWLAELK